MVLLDGQTLLISNMISNVICLVVMASLWNRHRKRHPELGFWLTGYIAVFFAMPFLIFDLIQQNPITNLFGTFLFVGAALLLFLGLKRFTVTTGSQVHNYISLAILAILYVYLALIKPSLQVRNIVLSIGLLVICTQAAWLLLKRMAKWRMPGRMGAGIVFSTFSLISILQILVYLLVYPDKTLFQSNLFEELVLLAYQMLLIGLTFAFFQMITHRVFSGGEISYINQSRAETELPTSESELQALFASMPDIILILDKYGRYLKIAPTNPNLLYKPPDSLIGKTLREVFPKVDAERYLSYIQSSLEFGKTVHFEYNLVVQEQEIWFSASISPMTDQSVVWVARDISEKKQAEALQQAVYKIASAAETTQSLDELFPKIHQIISSVMPAENFFITLFDELHKTLQYPYNTDTVDAPFFQEVQGGKGITSYVLKTGKSLLCTRAVHAELERQGEVKFVGIPSAIWLGVPLIIAGKTIGAMVVQHYTDPDAYTEREQHMLEFVSSQVAITITRKQAEKALADSELALRRLFAAMTDVVIVYDREGRYRDVAPTDPDFLFKPPHQLIGKSLHDVFAKSEADRLLKIIQTVLDTGAKMETEYSIKIGERLIWFTCTISPMQADTVIWVAHDITNRKKSEKVQEVIYEISKATISYDSIYELYFSIHTTMAELMHVENFFIALYDPSSELISFPYYVDQYDAPPPETKFGRGLTEYVMRTGRPLLASRKLYDELIRQGEVEPVGTKSVDWLGVPLKVEGQVIGVMVTQSYQEDIHFTQEDLRLFEFVSTQVALMIDRKRIEQKIRYMGIHDALTGLYNRAYFDEELKRLEHSRQFPVSVLMADLDDLKRINDKDGHSAGDDFLRRVAQVLKATFRNEDVIARIGGDEFAVLLPGIDAAMAEKAQQRILDYINIQNETQKGPQLQISMGISTVEKGGSLVDALRMADDQMYLKKQDRRLQSNGISID